MTVFPEPSKPAHDVRVDNVSDGASRGQVRVGPAAVPLQREHRRPL